MSYVDFILDDYIDSVETYAEEAATVYYEVVNIHGHYKLVELV